MFSSFIKTNMMISVLESNRKNKRNRRPIVALRQCLNAGPIVLPWRGSVSNCVIWHLRKPGSLFKNGYLMHKLIDFYLS